MQKRLLFLITLLLAMTTTVMAQITTSGISGKVMSQGEDVIGATITATHQPSGTIYRAVTNIDGRYTIQGMRVGGPYKVTVAYIGQKTKTFDNVMLRLGETEDLSCSLEDDSKELQEVVVKGSAGVNATKTGAAQSINSKQIADMPSITHGIADVARLNPQLTTTNSGAMSFAGTSNRYNSFMIDGAANNDVFGLSSDGTNGGRAGAQPVSMETIEQIQVNVAPFDVRQGGFTGGAITGSLASVSAFSGELVESKLTLDTVSDCSEGRATSTAFFRASAGKSLFSLTELVLVSDVDLQAGAGATVGLADDNVLRDVDQTTGQIA